MRKNRFRSGQLKTTETIIAVIVFSMMFIVAFVFFSRSQSSDISAEKSASAGLRAMDISQIITAMPELRCEIDNCIDIYRLNATAEWIKGKESGLFYSSAFGVYSESALYAKIYLREVYPDEKEFLIYDYPKAKSSSKQLFEFPVSIYNSTDERYSFGMLSITIYQ